MYLELLPLFGLLVGSGVAGYLLFMSVCWVWEYRQHIDSRDGEL